MIHCEQLEIVMVRDSLDGIDTFKILSKIMGEIGITTSIQIGRYKFDQMSFLTHLEKKGDWLGGATLEGLDLSASFVAKGNVFLVHVIETIPGASMCWSNWVKPFLAKHGFISARVSDVDYEFWQTTEQVAIYRSAGRDPSGLPLISNGLPPPLLNMDIDISSNPGRRVIKFGYIEAIGSQMWLSQIFWNLIGKYKPENLLSAGWTITEKMNGIELISVDSEVFLDGYSRESQDALRRALFG